MLAAELKVTHAIYWQYILMSHYLHGVTNNQQFVCLFLYVSSRWFCCYLKPVLKLLKIFGEFSDYRYHTAAIFLTNYDVSGEMFKIFCFINFIALISSQFYIITSNRRCFFLCNITYGYRNQEYPLSQSHPFWWLSFCVYLHAWYICSCSLRWRAVIFPGYTCVMLQLYV